MKKSHLWAALAAAGIALLASRDASAQQPRPAGPVGPVAILDLTYVFKNHARFQALTQAMKDQVEAAEKQLSVERDQLQTLAKSLEQYKRGTPEYKQLEEQLITRQNDLQLRVNLQKKTFLEQEAKIYYTVYQEVLDHVRYYADQNGTSLVLRFNGDPIDRNDPQEVLKELNKSVIYYNRAIDITPIILERVNRGVGPPVSSPAQAQQPSANATGFQR